ncbi:MAG TPA: MotA/TolQ/ExbB proton channel family protein [Nostocaceae cyanobacterium]|nr:MotA/TolQ/ExbB proton channel family protein [Nostocaceae cyanobacterium]
MRIGDIWNIIWQDSPFHWATATVLIIASIVEVYTLLHYLFVKCNQTERNIQELINRQSSRNVKSSDYAASDFQYFEQKIRKCQSALASPRISLRFVTTLCTAIGVLGTFYGIQQGLQDIGLNNINDSTELLKSSTKLLEGMKTAFSTSLMGLGSGSLFTLVLFVSDFFRQQRRNNLRNKLDSIVIPLTTDKANQKAAEALSNIADKFEGINQLSAESIGQAVGQQMQSVFLPALKSIYEEQKTLRQLQENQGQRVLQTLIQDLRIQVLEPIAERLDESAKLTQQASEAVSILHKELGGISRNLADSILTIQNFQKETLEELQTFAHNLGQTLSNFQTETKGVLQQTSVEINRAVEQSIAGMTAQRSAFESSAEQAAATFKGIREELQIALQERAEVEKQMLDGVRSGIVQILGKALKAFEQQNDTLKTFSNQASGLMNDARNNLISTLESIASTLTTTRQTFQEDLTLFRQEYQANLQVFFQQQNNVLESTLLQIQTETKGSLQQTSAEINRTVEQSIAGMTAQRSAFESSAEQAAVTFRGIREELQIALQERAKIEQQMLDGVRTGIVQILTQSLRTFQQQSNTLETVGNQASGLMNDARNNLIATLENIDSTLTATRQTVQDDLTLFRQEYQTNLQAFFATQNDLLEGTLGQQRDGLAEVVRNLQQVFQAEAQRRRELTQEVDESMNRIQESVETINQLVIAAGLNDSQRLIQLEALARGIGEEVQRVDNSYKNLSAQFQYSLDAWQNYLESSMQRTIKLQENFFQEVDNAMSKVCGDLLATSKVLVAAKDSGNNGHV